MLILTPTTRPRDRCRSRDAKLTRFFAFQPLCYSLLSAFKQKCRLVPVFLTNSSAPTTCAYLGVMFVTATTTAEIIGMNFSALRQPVFLQFLPALLLLHPLVWLRNSNAQTKNACLQATFVTATTTVEIIPTNISVSGFVQS